MEQFLLGLGDQVMKYIEPIYLVVFMAMAYIAKKPLNRLFTILLQRKFPIEKADMNMTVFVIGTLVAIPFWAWFNVEKMKMIVTFAMGTSLHDILISWFIKIIPKKPKDSE